MRRIQITSIVPSGANPGTITVSSLPENPSGDWTEVFRGRFYRDAAGATLPEYSAPTPPAGYTRIRATTFVVSENASYAGRYTVYTQPSALGLPSSTFSGGQTTIRVNEAIGAPLSPGDATTGIVTNVSTFYIIIPPAAPIVVPPETIIETLAFDLMGFNFDGWGEIFTQNLLRVAQNSSGPVAPLNPLIGQAWFDTGTIELKVWDGSAWNISSGPPPLPSTFRHTQAVASATWTINHVLSAAAPFVVDTSVFVDIGGGVYKPILPQDVTFNSANQVTVTFSTPYAGIALIRT